jgi:hypothetical protein
MPYVGIATFVDENVYKFEDDEFMTPEKSGEFSLMDIKVETFTVSNFLKT